MNALKTSVPTTAYHFVDKWRVKGDVKEVADIIDDALSLPRWWPSVYFEVKELAPGGEDGVGRVISLRAAGWLPYTLRLNFRTIESRYPNGFSMEATGDLEGTGIWTFEQDGRFVNITYDWTIRAKKAIIRHLSFLLKPIPLESQLDHEARRREPQARARSSPCPQP